MAAPKLMTYVELASVWGVSKEAARKKVEGLRLPKQMGNDGTARVMVDLTEVQHEPMKPKVFDRRTPGGRPESTPESDTSLRRLVSTLEAQVERLTALEASRRSDFEHERSRADGLSSDLASMRNDLDAQRQLVIDLTAEAAIAGALRTTVETLKSALDSERTRAGELRQDRDRWQAEVTRPRGLRAWFGRS